MSKKTLREVGVYFMVCLPTNKYYIGSSRNLRERRLSHYRLLRRHAHHIDALQQDFNVHGEGAFRWKSFDTSEHTRQAIENRVIAVFCKIGQLYNFQVPQATNLTYSQLKSALSIIEHLYSEPDSPAFEISLFRMPSYFPQYAQRSDNTTIIGGNHAE
jgi:group I intron endonuclease